MLTYITVSFILGIFGIILNLMRLTNPAMYITKPTTGTVMISTLISLGFVIWAGFLLFGGN